MQPTFDISSLVALVPSDPTPPTPPPIRVLVRELLSPVRHRWVTDLLFTRSASHLLHPNRPGLEQDAVLTQVSTVRVEPPHMRQQHDVDDESSSLTGTFLYAPALTVEAVTAGFGVMHSVFRVGSSGSIPPSPSSTGCKTIRTHFRFVHDAATDTLLEVYDLEDQHSVVISYARTVSATESRSFKARFHRGRLLAIVRQEQTAFYFDKVVDALQWFQTELQSRECPVCVVAGCSCERNLPAPSHPFDHGHFKRSMKHNLGTFEGVANKFRFADGTPTKFTKLGSRTSAHAIDNPVLMRTLTSWATASDHTATPPQQPMDPPMSAAFSHAELQENDSPSPGSNLIFPETHVMSPMQLLADAPEVGSSLLTPAAAEFEALHQQLGPVSPQLSAHVGDASGQDAVRNQMSEKEQKTEIRKQKNRESALRSNRKKKAIRDALELELNDLKEHEERLRVRENVLREENLRLRRSFVKRD